MGLGIGSSDERTPDRPRCLADKGIEGRRGAMKIRRVVANNRRKAFEVVAGRNRYPFPFVKLRLRPTATNRIQQVYVDKELGSEAFTYVLESGAEDSVHLDDVL